MNPFVRPLAIAAAAVIAASSAFGVASASAQAPVAAAAMDSALGLDPAVRTGVLENGLHYFIRRNTEPAARAELRLVIRAGSVLEDDDQRGLAHFLEHMAFNGTSRFEKNALVDYLEHIGMRFGADINASTSFDETIYELQVPTDSPAVMRTAFRILEDWSHAITFDSAEVEKERGVVIEEWRLGRGAGARMSDKQIPILLKGSRYAERLPIGDVATLETAPRERMLRFYHDWYRPDLMSVVVVGDIDPASMEVFVRDHFAALQMPASPRERPEYGIPDQGAPLVAIATDREATNTVVSVYFKRPRQPDSTLADYRRGILHGLFAQMFNDRLAEIAQRPDAPFIGASGGIGSYFGDRDAFSLGAVVMYGGARRGLDAVLTEAARVRQHGFTAPELERARQNLLRSYERAFAERDKTQSAVLAAELVRHATNGEPVPGIEREYGLVQRYAPGVQLAEVNALIPAWIGSENVVVAMTAPEKEGVAVPTEAELLAVIAAAGSRAVAPWAETVTAGALVEHPPAPGRIVQRDSIPEVGVTSWTLQNGVRVLLKPTDFKADQVLVSGWSPGGTSLLPDSLYAAAREAGTLVTEGGVGRFSRIDLQKALAGKAVFVAPTISDLSEGIVGSGSPRDLPTLFELTWLYFTEPRADSSAVTSFRQRAKGMLANRGVSPEAAFGDTLTVVLTSHHPRTRPVSTATVDSLDLDASMAFYRDRFADAGDFTFVIVGSFALDSIEPLVTQWLGALPSTGRDETWRDVGIVRPAGIVRDSVLRGTEPKALTQIVFHGPFEWTREARYALSSLEEVLRMRLRDVLREDLSGTYGVQVGGSPQRVPKPTYDLSIGYGSAPDRAGALERAIFTQVDSLRRTGPTADEVEKVREIQRRADETRLRENGFWLSTLAAAAREGTDPRLAVEGDALRATLTVDLLRDAAQRYLDPSTYVLVRLLPAPQP
jgi:zinc protease